MLRNFKSDLKGKRVRARDGEVGSVDDVYFDDERWVVRYLVVDTGDWLPGRRVLVSPASVVPGRAEDDAVHVDLDMDKVRSGPGVDTDRPVSRQFEEAHARYYGYPFYWDGPYLWGSVQHPVGTGGPVTSVPGGAPARERVRELKQAEQQARESHLRSAKEVTGYRVAASDGDVGHVEDFAIATDDWSIVKLVVDTRDWLPGGNVTIPVEAVEHIDWAMRQLRARATREEIKGSPKAS